MAERPQCVALKSTGDRCGVRWGLSPDGFCLMHDEARRPQAEAIRAAARTHVTTGAKVPYPATPTDGKFRVVPPSAVPRGRPPRTVDDCIKWASWLAYASVTGVLDGTTVRECNRSLATLKDSFHKRDMLAEIRRLKALVARYEQERARE